MLFAQRRSCIS